METKKDYQQRLPEHEEHLLEQHYDHDAAAAPLAAAPVAATATAPVSRGLAWLGWCVAALVAVGVMFAGVYLAQHYGNRPDGESMLAVSGAGGNNLDRQYVAGISSAAGAKTAAVSSASAASASVAVAGNSAAVVSPTDYVYYFENNNSTIADNKELNELADRVAGTDADITVTGYADPTGSAAYNQRLSERRADNVARYLVAHGVDKSHIKTVGAGQTDAFADYASDRRAEIHVE